MKSEEYLGFGGDLDEIPEDDNILQTYHLTTEETKIGHDTWYVDTSATHHFTYRKDWWNCYRVLSNPLLVTFGDIRQKPTIDKGSIQFRLSDSHEITFPNVYNVPGLAKDLFLVGQATVRGLII